MPLIEGLGDEVTFVLGAFLMFLILLLAWFSTHTSEIPLLREVGVIVVELSQRRIRDTAVTEDGERSSPEGQDSASDSQGAQADSDEVTDNIGDGVHAEPRASSSQSVSLETQSSQQKSRSSSIDVSHGNSSGAVSLPVAADMVTAEYERQLREQDLSSESLAEDTVSPVPAASVVADEDGRIDSELSDHPCEDEMRRRRVQYFQTSTLPDHNTQSYGEGVPSNTDLNADELNSLAPLSTRLCDTTGVLHLESISKPSGAMPDGEDHSKSPSEMPSVSGQVPSDSGEGASSNHIETDGQSSTIRVKLKYMNETQRLVHASPMDTIGDFRRAHFQTELEEDKWVRFIYNGQDLRDDARTLQACNVADNCTMHCLITAHTRTTPTRDASTEEDADDSVLGALMYPLFTLVLLVVWYFRFTYRQYFSAMSTVCLIGISFLLALSYISSLRTTDTLQQQQTEAAGGQQQNRPHQD